MNFGFHFPGMVVTLCFFEFIEGVSDAVPVVKICPFVWVLSNFGAVRIFVYLEVGVWVLVSVGVDSSV